MKKCPFCQEDMEDDAVKCIHCGGMLDKYIDWERMINTKQQQPEKKYFKTSFLIIALLCVGPFALPFLWFNPRFSQKTKIIVSVIVIIISYYLLTMFMSSITSASKYYQQIFSPTF